MTPPLHMFALQVKGSIIIIDKLLNRCHKVFLIFPYIFYNSRWDKLLPLPSSLSADRNLGSSIRYAREKRDYTREQIADRAEISSRFLAAIENDKRKPSLDVLIRLVNAIGASFDEILAPQIERGSETIDRIQRLILQCSQRDQELLLALIDKMLDTREKQEKK